MRAYTVAATAIALRVDQKWLDNLLSHHHVPGVPRGRQGVQRRIGPDALLRIGVTLRLARDLGIPIARALALATETCDGRRGEAHPAPHVALRIDLLALERELTDRLVDAAHMLAPIRRGRPARRR